MINNADIISLNFPDDVQSSMQFASLQRVENSMSILSNLFGGEDMTQACLEYAPNTHPVQTMYNFYRKNTFDPEEENSATSAAPTIFMESFPDQPIFIKKANALPSRKLSSSIQSTRSEADTTDVSDTANGENNSWIIIVSVFSACVGILFLIGCILILMRFLKFIVTTPLEPDDLTCIREFENTRNVRRECADRLHLNVPLSPTSPPRVIRAPSPPSNSPMIRRRGPSPPSVPTRPSTNLPRRPVLRHQRCFLRNEIRAGRLSSLLGCSQKKRTFK
jgi:hypothetical protein